VQLVRTLRAQRERAVEVLPEDLHHYLDERILVGTWYPLDDVFRATRALIDLGGGGDKGWDRAGTLLARNDLHTVYAHFIQGKNVESALRSIAALWSNYYDTGKEHATFSPGTCTIELEGFALRDAGYCRMIGAYNAELINATGGRVLATRKVACTARGQKT